MRPVPRNALASKTPSTAGGDTKFVAAGTGEAWTAWRGNWPLRKRPSPGSGCHGTRRRAVREQLGAPYVSRRPPADHMAAVGSLGGLGLPLSLRDVGCDGGAAMRDALYHLARLGPRSSFAHTPWMPTDPSNMTIGAEKVITEKNIDRFSK